MRVVRCFPAQNIVACYDEAPGGGNIEDINAPCNAPAKSPHLHLSRVYWHVDFFQYELAMPLQNKTVAHTSLAGETLYFGTAVSGSGLVNGSTSPPSFGQSIAMNGDLRVSNITLVTHNLGYIPAYFVAYAGHSMTSGTLVQTQGTDGRSRYVSAFATTSIIGLREVAISSASALAAANRSYQVMVFRNPTTDPARPLMGLNSDGINITIGRGKVDTSKQYLRRVLSSESNFDLDLGRTIDLRGGGIRIASGGVIVSDNSYDGNFAGSSYIPVGV